MLAAADELIGSAFARLGGEELLAFARRLEVLARKVWAVQIRIVDEIDQQGLATARSCTSTQAMLRQTLNITPGEASLRVRTARATRPQDQPSGAETPALLGLLGAAIDAGLVDGSHVRTTLATMDDLPDTLDADLVLDAEQTLVGYAVETEPVQFTKIAAHLVEVMNPDGTPDHRGPAGRMELTIGARSTATGLTSIHGRLDDLGIATLRTAIDGLAAPSPGVDGSRDVRPAALRRAQALVALCEFALSQRGVPARQGGERPQITVTLNWDVIHRTIGSAVLDDGHPVSPATVRRLLCDATVIPAVLGGAGEVLDLGRSARTFNRATRRAITLRDKGCAWPGCDRPPAWTDCHHVEWWVRDLGETSYHNGCLLCAHHHAEIHKGDWVIVFAIDGVPEFIPPKWLDPTQTPRRNTVHHLTPETTA